MLAVGNVIKAALNLIKNLIYCYMKRINEMLIEISPSHSSTSISFKRTSDRGADITVILR